MTDRSWHDESYPELREGRPWVMEEMVAAEPSLAGPILGESDAADRVARNVAQTARAGAPVVVTGCGTSEHAALAIAALLDEALGVAGLPGGRVESRQALDAALDPRAGGLCIGVSHDGGTRATMLALEAARTNGARTALVTARPEADAARAADDILATPLVDRSWCHTVAYVSAILSGEALAGRIRSRPSDAGATERFLSSCLTLEPGLGDAARALDGVSTTLAAGLGADEITARELALKIEEGARVPATARHLETLLHGHLAACDSTTGLVLFATDLRSGARLARRVGLAVAAAGAIGMPTILVSPETVETWPVTQRVELPAAEGLDPFAASFLGGAVTLQLLTLALIYAAGVNPDLIRREEKPWREAARLGDGGDW